MIRINRSDIKKARGKFYSNNIIAQMEKVLIIDGEEKQFLKVLFK